MKEIRFAKFLVILNCAVPAILLGWDAWHDNLGANPVNFAIRTTGLLALIYLFLSLVISPAKQLSGWNWLAHFRRTLGLYAFFSALLHFSIFFWWDRDHNVRSTITEIITRNYLWFGTTSLILMLPLAVTSTNFAINKLGPKRWKALHRLTYIAAIAGGIHYIMVGKFVMKQAIVFAAVLGVLLLYRIIAAIVVKRMKPKFWRGQLKLVKKTEETPTVRTFRLAPIDGRALPFNYQPGQYLNLALTVDGKPVKRSYTIASSPTRKGYCELTVKREDMGVSSRHLHDTLHEGDVIDVSAPAGKFTFTGKSAKSVVLIAGGVGITPLMSKIRYLTDRSWTGDIFLIFITRLEADIIFRRELEDLQRKHRNLHVTISLTREESPNWTGNRGRLTPKMLQKIVPNIADREVHICGPDEMATETQTMLAKLGVPKDRIKYESFTPAARTIPADAAVAKPMDDSAPVAGAMLTFDSSGQSAVTDPDKTILDLAEETGVEIPYDCRSGICGTCKIKMLSGQVSMETQDALTADDRKNGLILGCQARCLGDVAVEA